MQTGSRLLSEPGQELLVASSFSKNFGLYNERVGALSAVCRTDAAAQAVLSQIKTCIRANYSNPPAHGAAIVTTILSDPQLRTRWDGEVRQIPRANQWYAQPVCAHLGRARRQPGLFFHRPSTRHVFILGLTPDQVRRLRDEYSIYIVGSGRINVAGMTEANMAPLCSAIADILQMRSTSGRDRGLSVVDSPELGPIQHA